MKRDEIINKFTEKCKERFGEDLVSVVLFGSYARGTAKEYSDIDLLVVARKLPKDSSQRWQLLKDIRMEILLNHSKSIETLLLTPDELRENFWMTSPLFSTLVIGSKILYDTGFFQPEFQRFVNQIKDEDITYYGERRWEISKLARSFATSR